MADQGAKAYAQKEYAHAIALFEAAYAQIKHCMISYNIACCHALSGDKEKALAWLKTSVDDGFMDKAHLLADEDLATLRADQEFDAIVASIPAPAAEETLDLKNDSKLPSLKFYVAVPAGYDKEKHYPVLLSLPPGPGDKQMVQAALDGYWGREAYKRGYLVVCPEIQGQSLQGRSNDVIAGILEVVKNKYSGDLDQVILAGASNGGVGAMLVAAETWNAKPFKGVIGFPAMLNADDYKALKKMNGFPFYLRVGSLDSGWKDAQTTAVKTLESLGAKVNAGVMEGRGHIFQMDLDDVFAWIEQALHNKAAKAGN